MPNDLLGQIHSSSATTSPDWATFRGEVTGMYLLSGQGGEWDSQHLIREYNRNINSLYKSWTPTEPNATGLFLEPYNAGFSYQGTGDFRDYKWDTYSLDFDGVDDFIDLGSQAGALRLYNSNGTISAWVKIDDVSAGDSYKRIVDKSDGGSGLNGYYIYIHTNGAVVGGIDGGSTVISPAGTITDATWHHVVWTWDGTNHKIYVDGSLDTTAASTARPPSDTTNMRIGTWNHSTAREFKGLMDEVAIWNSALSAEQITAIYNGGTPQSLAPYSPLAWWRMGDYDVGYIGGAYGVITDQMDTTLGSDLITNGGFDADSGWFKDTGWTISGGTANCDGSQSANSNLYQNAGLGADGTPYQVTFTVSNYSAGTVRTVVGGYAGGIWRSANGTYTERIWVRSGPTFHIQADANFIGSIDNVVVKKINGYAGAMENMSASDIAADTP